MQNNNIEYLRKSIKKLNRFNHFSMIISLIISCVLGIITILAFMKKIEFETFLIVFLCLEIIYYLSKLKRIQLIEKIDKSDELKKIAENCSCYSKEELDDCHLLLSTLLKSVDFSLIIATFIKVTRCKGKLEESTKAWTLLTYFLNTEKSHIVPTVGS